MPSAAQTGDLSALRSQALELVNEARREDGRAPLTFSDTLNEIAQGHAEDMLARDYYAHVSPEGEDARDRYIAAGGGRYELVAENIASCSPCAEGPRPTHVEQMQRQWMESRHHRENILSAGVTQFGYGIVAGDEGPLYAVQTFAGPGTPRGAPAASGGTAEPALAADEAGPAFARALNARREARSRPPLEVSDALSETAAGLLPERAGGEVAFGRGDLAGSSRDWATTSALVGSCGGCGAEIARADIDTFLEMWLANPAYEQRLLGQGPTSVGFALRAYGDGRKVAVAVLGERR
jgi:Cysteine-rich secretory protein family